MKDFYRLRLVKLGEIIKETRQLKSITQQSLAELSDIDIRTIQRLEKGDLNISINIFISVIQALGLDSTEVIAKITELK